MSIKKVVIAGAIVFVGILFLKLPWFESELSFLQSRQYTEIQFLPPEIRTDDARVAIFAICCICAFCYLIAPAVNEYWPRRR